MKKYKFVLVLILVSISIAGCVFNQKSSDKSTIKQKTITDNKKNESNINEKNREEKKEKVEEDNTELFDNSYLYVESNVKEIQEDSLIVTINREGEQEEVVLKVADKGYLEGVNSLKDFNKDDIALFYMKKNKPMTMQYPPIYNADVIIKGNKDERYDVSKYNEDLINAENTLQLNIDNQVTIINGDKNNLKNKDLFIIYDISTRSIPAQTTPKQIVVLN